MAQPPATELLARLSSEDAATRKAGWEDALRYGTPAIGSIAPLLDSLKFEVARAARIALENLAGAATADPAARKQAADALAMATLSVKNKEWLLWLLSYVGTQDSLNALLALLENAPEDFDRTLMTIESLVRANPEAPASAEEGAGHPQGVPLQEVPKKLLELLPPAPEQHQIAIINALGSMRAEAAVPDLLAMTEGPLHLAAVRALGNIGNAEALPGLMKEYQQTQSVDVLDALLRIVEQQESATAQKTYLRLLKLLPKPEEVLDAAQSPVANAQAACLAGLAQATPTRSTLKLLIHYLAAPRADVSGAAKLALIGMQGEAVDHALNKAMKKADPEYKVALLETLSGRNLEAAEPALRGALEDPAEEVRLAAFSLLAQRARPENRDLYLHAAKEEAEVVRPVALAAYLKVATAVPEEESLEIYHTGLEIASRDEERRLALEGLRTIAAPDSLPLLESLPVSPSLQTDILLTELAIAAKAEASDKSLAIDTYRKVLASNLRPYAQQAAEGLKRLGVTEDFARDAGFVTEWMVIGPFATKAFNEPFPPEQQPFDASAQYEGAQGQQVNWHPTHTDDALGVVDLEHLFTPKENVAAYARTVLHVPAEQKVLFKMGSDDGIILWLNGTMIHKNNASRRIKIDEDIVSATLSPGENVLLVKIVQGGSDWGFTVRMTDESGAPLRLPDPPPATAPNAS